MKGSGIILILLFCCQCALAQMDLFSFTAMLDQNPRKLEAQLEKKGFSRTGHSFAGEQILYTNTTLEDSMAVNRSFHVVFRNEACELVYKTSSRDEFKTWEQEIKSSARAFCPTGNSKIYYYHKQGVTLQWDQETLDTTTMYVVSASKKNLPKPKELAMAEDLLQLDAHIYLETVFGEENVKEDVFYFSETLKSKCSVIFPNTSRQAIFLWKDERHLKDLSFIIIGEQTRKTQPAVSHQVTLPSWTSRQGIYCGMNIRDVELLNGAPISFYRYKSQYAGALAPGNSGKIDFETIELVFDCLNCSFVTAGGRGDVIDSETATRDNQKWYVSSFAVIK